MRRTLQALADFFAKRWPHLNAESDFQRKIVSRLCMVERNIMLPIKLGLILVVLRFLFFSAEVYPSPHSRAVALDTVRFFFVIYLLITVGCSIMIAGIRTLPLWYVELVVLIAAILDIILLSALTMITGGLNSPLFWFYLLLSMRNSLSIYSPTTQITVNSLTILAYLFAGLTDIRIAQIEGESIIANTDYLALRLVILGAMTLFSYY
ncbi:MAG: hypothetical protein ACO3PR_14290, partial [Limisphaerales bacterium]